MNLPTSSSLVMGKPLTKRNPWIVVRSLGMNAVRRPASFTDLGIADRSVVSLVGKKKRGAEEQPGDDDNPSINDQSEASGKMKVGVQTGPSHWRSSSKHIIVHLGLRQPITKSRSAIAIQVLEYLQPTRLS